MPRYDLNIAIFETIRYIVPSLNFGVILFIKSLTADFPHFIQTLMVMIRDYVRVGYS